MKVFFVACLTIVFSYANAQIAITNSAHLDKIKNNTVYVIMKDPSSERSAPYVEAFKKNWILSKIQFINPSDMEKKLQPGNYFMSITGERTTTTSSNGTRSYSNTHLYLELWTPTDKFFRKSRDFSERDKQSIARLELYTDFETEMNPKLLMAAEFDGEGRIYNWGPGIVGNQLQSLTTYLNAGKTKALYSFVINQNEVRKLAKDTLYIPDYIFVKFTGRVNKQDEHDRADILKGYSLPYKVVSVGELNERISGGKAIHYLVYVKSSTDKFVSVYNSQSGELVYSRYTPISYNFKWGDLGALQRAVEKD